MTLGHRRLLAARLWCRRSHMGRVSAANLQPGMVLAGDVHTFRGQLLLPAGTTLSDKYIEKLMAWGVSEADIEGQSDPTLEEVNASMESLPELAAQNEALDRRFAEVTDDPVMQEILRIAKQQLLAKYA
jgi:hypothetical protein